MAQIQQHVTPHSTNSPAGSTAASATPPPIDAASAAPAATTNSLTHKLTANAMTASMHPLHYRVAPPESWTDEEQATLEATLRQYPSSQYSTLTQCAQAAARLPKKTIRDVSARLHNMPHARAPEDSEFCRHMDDLLRANLEVIAKMRDNLHKIDLLDNIPLMAEFDRNVAAAFDLLRRLDAKMPPFPVRVNTMYLTNEHSSNASADAFDSASSVPSSAVVDAATRKNTIDHPPNIHIPPL